MEENIDKEEYINNLENEISSLISKLSSFASDIGDWKIIKCYEATLQGKSLPYDIDDLMEKRQQVRDRINEIQQELKELED